jgi:hypothetical protein
MRFARMAVFLQLAACSYFVFTVPKYTASPENVMVLRGLHQRPVNVGPFSAVRENTALSCRGEARVATDDGEPFSQYIRAALVSELKMADAYDPNAAVTITGLVERADFYSASKRWEIELTVSSSNGRRMHIDGSWYWRDNYSSAPAGCQDAATSLVPAVQDTISRIVNDPTFPAFLAAPEAGPGTPIPGVALP